MTIKKIDQVDSPKKSKLVSLLRQFIGQDRFLTMNMQENETDKLDGHHTNGPKCPPLETERELGPDDRDIS
jgi:hypothetical protein